MILGEDGEKMSKSRGNVINPDDIVRDYGADTMRLYEMFLGDFEKAAPWSQNAVKGCRRFLDRVWALFDSVQPGGAYSQKNESAMHKTIKKVTEDIENLKFNTAIAALMSLLNTFGDNGVNKAEYQTFIALLSPFAPHICEELNQRMGGEEMLARAPWPQYDPAKTVDETVEIGVQINGKVKSAVAIGAGDSQEQILEKALADPKTAAALEGMKIVKTIVIPGRIVNIVVKPA